MALILDGTNGLTYTGGTASAVNFSVPQNVGIGTESPGARLEVKGNSSDNATININNNSGNIWKLWNDNGASGLNIQYNGATRLVIDASGNVGIGTSSPLGKLKVTVGDNAPAASGNMNTGVVFEAGATGRAINFGVNNTAGYSWINAAFANNSGVSDNLVLMTGATERMRIDSSGNVGIGTSSPSVNLDVVGTSGLRVKYGAGSGLLLSQLSSGGAVYVNNQANDALVFATNNTERMRIDGGGNLLVGKTSPTYTTSGVSLSNSTNQFAWSGNSGSVVASFATPVNQFQIGFYRTDTGALMGSIVNGASNTVAYNTSSDYRLKDNVKPMTGALAKVAALRPVTWTWKEDEIAGEGFIAHEVQAIVPDAVTGEKDAVDDKGNPRFQGIDTSFLVATLTAAIQEQQALITALTARITALEQT